VTTILDTIQNELNRIDATFRTVSITHIPEIREEITHWKQQGIIPPEFYNENYSLFKLNDTQIPQGTQSLIIIAIPQRITPLDFRLHGQSHLTVIPPTYIYSRSRATCLEILTSVFAPTQHTASLAPVPYKLLSVRSGLGRYGKNNVCYIQGTGSFYRLEAFYTDYPSLPDDWQPSKALEQCSGCSRCINACPTQAIDHTRFLVHADRCLTYFNENEREFPKWIPSQVHHALVGCLRCQFACPLNRTIIQSQVDPVVFTEEETKIILEKTPWDNLPSLLAVKLKMLDIDGYYSVLPRNLKALLDKH